ncbi:hypothetical protein BH09BAC5_BH09BAC5_29000 [soil metagenome]
MKRKLFFTVLCAMLVIGVGAQLPPNVPSNGLVGYWAFNNNANDDSGFGNNGTVNGPVSTNDRFNNPNSAYHFDGINDFITITSTPTISQGVRTYNFWIKSTSSTLMQPIKKSDYSTASGEQFGFAVNASVSDQVDFAVKYNSGCTPAIGWTILPDPTDVTNGNWRMITGVVTTTQIQLYVDGVLVGVITAGNTIGDACGGDLEFGRNWSGDQRWFDGEIDDVGLWNRALSDCEIERLYAGLPNLTASLNVTTLSANFIGTGTYQWVNCNSSYSIITGANSASFTPTTNGTYALIFTGIIGSCNVNDTTPCYTVNDNSLITIPSYVPYTGLVGYWPFTGNGNDESGNQNHGTVNGPTLTSDRNSNTNNAYSFDGVDDYITVGNTASVSTNIGTINFWVQSSSTALMQLVKKSNYSDATGEQYGFAANANASNRIDFSVKYNSNCNVSSGWRATNTPDIITDGNWNMITGLITEDSLILFINAVRVSATAVPNPQMDYCTGALEFGRNWALDPRLYIGNMDDIGLWNRVLNNCEIEQLYHSSPTTFSISQPAGDLIASPSSGTFQWLDCDNSNAVIPGATASFYTPTVNGNYAVIITTPGGCMDTTLCYNVSSVGIASNEQTTFLMYPNPTNEFLYVRFKTITSYALYDAQGRILQSYAATKSAEIDLRPLRPGVYYIRTAEGNVERIIRN